MAAREPGYSGFLASRLMGVKRKAMIYVTYTILYAITRYRRRWAHVDAWYGLGNMPTLFTRYFRLLRMMTLYCDERQRRQISF